MQFIAISTLAFAALAVAAPWQPQPPSYGGSPSYSGGEGNSGSGSGSGSGSSSGASNNGGSGQCASGTAPAAKQGQVYCCQTGGSGLINLDILNCFNLGIAVPVNVFSNNQ